jgi:polyisoprenoid-binding protein YceI
MGIATVRGRFSAFEGTLEAEVDGAFKAHGTVQAASIDTDDPKRDDHLRAPELFDVGGYPEITFVSSGLLPAGGSSFGMFGNLTIKGMSRPIALTVTVAEVSVDPWGHERLALAAQGEIDRKEFGLTWSQALESGGVLVANR